MAVRDWHWGQLLIFWIASALIWFGIGGALYAFGLLGEPDGAYNWGHAVIVVLMWLLFPGIPLTVSWRWFGGRRRAP